jgi:dipeptidyl aminopeptidase/acylaminoacyl peptidase
MKTTIVVSMLLACACVAPAFAIPPTSASVEPFVRPDNFNLIKISPDGKYLALSVPLGDHTKLVVLDAATLKQVSVFGMAGKTHVDNFWWANPNRLLISMAERNGSLDSPIPTGEIFATNADGKDTDLLFGYRAAAATTGTRITSDRRENASARMIQTLPDDPDHVLIAVTPWSYAPGVENYTSVERMDVREGHRARLGTVPLKGAELLADHHGQVRFAFGRGSDFEDRLYYRESDTAPWVLINDANVSKRKMTPLGFAADDSLAYVRSSEPTGPDSLQKFDVAKRSMTLFLQDKSADPNRLLFADGSHRDPIGVIYEDDKPRVTYFDPDSAEARSQRSLMASFDGEFVLPISSTADGKIELVEAYSDRNAGDIYRFDKSSKKADLLIGHRDWFDPAKMAESRPFAFKARDGMEVHGYLTIPHGSDGKALPMVVYPHGGPFGIFDEWRFDTYPQLLAAHGYAVLQVNYRGSGNRGSAFEDAGHRQWGGKMQDDLTDATHWAIDSGAADKNRICIFGGSYGGYAALMGVAKEPTLYRCAVGYAGVYDLARMFQDGDFQRYEWGQNYLKRDLGTDNLAAVSPVKLADRIKVPVFLAGGGEDKRAPLFHTQEMESALKQAGGSVQTLTFSDEGHGFYDPDHVTKFDIQLLQFLDQNIGDGAAKSH